MSLDQTEGIGPIPENLIFNLLMDFEHLQRNLVTEDMNETPIFFLGLRSVASITAIFGGRRQSQLYIFE
jgi:hypothetical protein